MGHRHCEAHTTVVRGKDFVAMEAESMRELFSDDARVVNNEDGFFGHNLLQRLRG